VTKREAGKWHLGLGRRDSEFARFSQLLLTSGFCRSSRHGGGQRVSDDAAPVAAWTLSDTNRARILAAAAG
jgi:hypothetical protein